jgi:hypothetical protein
MQGLSGLNSALGLISLHKLARVCTDQEPLLLQDTATHVHRNPQRVMFARSLSYPKKCRISSSSMMPSHSLSRFNNCPSL